MQPDGNRERVRWEPGAAVDGYTVLEKLGQGGMGAVFLVEHRATGGRFALKTLAAGAEPELLLRFQREAEAQARVDGHPNVLRIHSVGTAGGQAYLVMDLATGGDLHRRLEGGPLAPREAANVVRDLALGLAHVHAHGILHRDLKPHNVLFDERGTPRLVDFGLAKLAGGDRLTRTGELMGTPAYMAPEQALGQHEAVDARSDVYGLGGILYAALTGGPPFRGQTFELLTKVCNDPPTPPSRLADVPRDLEAVVLRCLEKDPAKRYPSAEALAQALTAWLEGKSSAGRRTPLAAALVLTGVALAGSVALLVMGGNEVRRPAPPPVVPPGEHPRLPLEPTPQVEPAAVEPSSSPEEHFAAVLADIGELSEEPPADLPRAQHDSWRMAYKISYTAFGYGQALAPRNMKYARQWYVYCARAGKNPRAWVDLGDSYARRDTSEFDETMAAQCYMRAAKAGLAAGAMKLGGLIGWGSWDDPSRTAWAVACFRWGLGMEEDNVGSQARCAERLGNLALEAPHAFPGELAIPILEQSLANDRRGGTNTGRKLTLARLLLEGKHEDRSADVERLLREVCGSSGTHGDDAAALLAPLLHEGWGTIARDPVEAVAVLRARIGPIRAREPTPYAWAGPARVQYQLACALTQGDVPRDEKLAAELWTHVVELDPTKGWLHWASLRQLMDLGTSEDPEIRRQASDAEARLRAGSQAGHPDARTMLERGLR